MRTSLDELQAFVSVYETGGFTAAGRRLRLTTNAISLRVQRLEAELEVRLFLRTTRRVVATEEGRRFYARVSPALLALEEAEADLRPIRGGLRGTVRIAVPGPLATVALHARLRRFLDAHPQLNLQTKVANTPIDLTAEAIDIGVVVGPLKESMFVGRHLTRAQWVLAATAEYLEHWGRPRTPADLVHHRCLRALSSRPQDEWTLVGRDGRQVTVSVGGGYEADDSRALADATYAGLGIGIRPPGECARAVKAGRLVRVLPEFHFQPFDVYALLPKGRIRLPQVAACLEVVRAAVLEQS